MNYRPLFWAMGTVWSVCWNRGEIRNHVKDKGSWEEEESPCTGSHGKIQNLRRTLGYRKSEFRDKRGLEHRLQIKDTF